MVPLRRADIDSERRFEKMYRQYEPKVLAYALRRASPELAKDAVAETFLAAWRRLDDLPEDPLPWLISAARKALSNQRRSAGRQVRLAARLSGLVSAEAERADVHDPAAVRTALERLRPSEREALLLIGWDGLSPSQAARSLQCSATAFRVRLHRARRAFGHLLADERGASSDWRSPAATKEGSRP
jgi:RNA polymerase sigma factor (sigma-70 family)